MQAPHRQDLADQDIQSPYLFAVWQLFFLTFSFKILFYWKSSDISSRNIYSGLHMNVNPESRQLFSSSALSLCHKLSAINWVTEFVGFCLAWQKRICECKVLFILFILLKWDYLLKLTYRTSLLWICFICETLSKWGKSFLILSDVKKVGHYF